MKLETTIEFVSGDQVLLRLQAIEIFDDGSGGYGLLTVNSGHFSCTSFPFYFDKLEPFCQAIPKLYIDVKGEIRLGQIYERDFIELKMDKFGHVIVRGEVEESGMGQKLVFCFTSDQTCLPSLVESTKCVMKEIETANKTLHPIRSQLRRLLKGEC
jgi:hypothetical protein